MIAWNTFWQGLVIISIACFAVLSLYIMIGGFWDVLAMFRRIDQQHAEGKAKRRLSTRE